jgi:5,10-methenyltetrahydromethanopterin hydrogenase
MFRLSPEDLLQRLDLKRYKGPLCEYGIDTVDDLLGFSEEELVEAGLKKGHARRLRKNAKEQSVKALAAALPEGCKTHVFLTHSWDKEDELGRNNHDVVALVNKELKKLGVITWFDAERMEGQITDQMCHGINEAAVVAVFVTQRYIDKVFGKEENDNCKVRQSGGSRAFMPAAVAVSVGVPICPIIILIQ